MPPPKKALRPASRAKADKRNERDKAARAAKAAASGGRKSGKKRKATTDLAEEEMPTSSGGSWKRSGELMFALLEEKQKGHFEAEKLALAEEAASQRSTRRAAREYRGSSSCKAGIRSTWSGLKARRQRKSKC